MIIAITFLCTSIAWAQGSYSNNEEEGLSYDTLIRKLSQGGETRTQSPQDPLNDVTIHLGVGLANSLFTIQHPNGDKTQGAQRGVQVAMGIDLFSRNWLAETTFRNYGESQFNNTKLSTKEFDLKILYHSKISPVWGFQTGGGLAARYMKVNYSKKDEHSKPEIYNQEFETPSTVVQAGLMTYLGQSLSIGADAALRTALIDETIDRSSIDLTIRLDGHF